MLVDITHLESGSVGIVKEIVGGPRLMTRVQNMGIRVGKKVKKVSSHFWHGPQTVEIDNFNVALGYGIAKKIFVQILK